MGVRPAKTFGLCVARDMPSRIPTQSMRFDSKHGQWGQRDLYCDDFWNQLFLSDGWCVICVWLWIPSIRYQVRRCIRTVDWSPLLPFFRLAVDLHNQSVG